MKYKWLIAFLGVWVWSLAAYGQPEAPLLGDESDGSRAHPVHLIPLVAEDEMEILPDEEPLVPFSVRQTCALKCHSYPAITSGWHFNALVESVSPGRPGHPWLYSDSLTGTLIPLSYRNWPGAYKPDEIGMTTWEFIKRFGRHLPGSGAGEFEGSPDPEKVMRRMVSGKLEANCLACHDADPAHDQAEYALQIARENFRWAAASTSGFTTVTGSAAKMPDTFDFMMPDDLNDAKLVPPTVEFNPAAFDSKNRVFFNLVREAPNHRCYYCHSTKDVIEASEGKWAVDEDVHLKAGLTCVDCHRNGLDHNIVRGYEGEEQHSSNPLAALSSCVGCHLGGENAPPAAGRLGAPVPKHRGLPLVHFEKLTCTACHSGPWPDGQTHRIKTAMAHALGTRNVNKEDDVFPHIQAPVLAAGADGKIAPHYAVWPSFWGVLEGGTIKPLSIENRERILSSLYPTDSEKEDIWALADSKIKAVLSVLASLESLQGKPVFVAGGKVHQLDKTGALISSTHDAAQPYLWPMAHDVRPAAQSLGVRGCADCHTTDADFFFGIVAVDSPLKSDAGAAAEAIAFQELDRSHMKTLAFTFIFRPWFKAVTLLSVGIIGLVLLLYALKGLSRIMNFLSIKANADKQP